MQSRAFLERDLGDSAQPFVGEWQYANDTKGPAAFVLTESCDLTDGGWGYDLKKPPQSPWQVSGRQ